MGDRVSEHETQKVENGSSRKLAILLKDIILKECIWPSIRSREFVEERLGTSAPAPRIVAVSPPVPNSHRDSRGSWGGN
jgi:hypothetical protein